MFTACLSHFKRSSLYSDTAKTIYFQNPSETLHLILKTFKASAADKELQNKLPVTCLRLSAGLKYCQNHSFVPFHKTIGKNNDYGCHQHGHFYGHIWIKVSEPISGHFEKHKWTKQSLDSSWVPLRGNIQPKSLDPYRVTVMRRQWDKDSGPILGQFQGHQWTRLSLVTYQVTQRGTTEPNKSLDPSRVTSELKFLDPP
jgi:hypothetical protein